MIEYEDLGKVNEPFFDAFKKAFDEVLRSGWYILGSHVKSFEKDFAIFLRNRLQLRCGQRPGCINTCVKSLFF